MDAFGDDFTAAAEVDPAAEFLAREQDQLAGLEDELLNGVQPNEMDVQPIQDGFMTDAFDGQANVFEGHVNGDALNFGDQPDAFGSAVVDGFSAAPAPVVESTPAPAPVYSLPKEEPEKIRKWREEQKLRLEKKDEEEEKKKQEMKENARKELEEWYRHHKEAIEKTRAANRNAEKELVAQPTEMEPGQEWERIAKLCDFNPKASRNSKDVSRMRSIILQLKQSPPVTSH